MHLYEVKRFSAVTLGSQHTNEEDLSPAERVRHILGPIKDEDEIESGSLFVQMDALMPLNDNDDTKEWMEVARWVKYEEVVEGRGERWSKPFVSSVRLHSLFELRQMLQIEGGVDLNVRASDALGVTAAIVDRMVKHRIIHESLKTEVMSTLIKRHWPQKEQKYIRTKKDTDELRTNLTRNPESLLNALLELERGVQTTSERDDSRGLDGRNNNDLLSNNRTDDADKNTDRVKVNKSFMRKVKSGTEAVNILVGELSCLESPASIFIRLEEPLSLDQITEIPLETRFMFVMLVPSLQASTGSHMDVGRAVAVLMCDEVFREVAYKALVKQDLVAGIDEFMDTVLTLPPSVWNPSIRLEPPQGHDPPRRVVEMIAKTEGCGGVDDTRPQGHGDPTLRRTGRLFGGFVQDIKRRLPWYLDDFKNALHPQCFASFVFLYFAALAPIVTFGGLLGQGTENYMGPMECILAGAICGVLFHLFAGQPLTIVGPTGPMLVLEVIIFHFAHDFNFDFLSFRVWIGVWTFVLLLVIVAFDMSAFVMYITRFTEESFSVLISTIFIYDAISKLIFIASDHPVNLRPDVILDYDCHCLSPNISNITAGFTAMANSSVPIARGDYSNANGNLTLEDCESAGGAVVGTGCNTPLYEADVFFLSFILFFLTFSIAWVLKTFRTAPFFPSKMRATMADFGVFLAILIVTGIDWGIGLETPKLVAPQSFKPSKPRSWFVNPVSGNPWWTILAAAIPAFLSCILIFMDQQITAVIVNRKDNKLKKGSGYHLDLFIVAVTVLICSFFGLPWYVASTVVSITHVTSLRQESECTAPGERPKFIGVREQRLTGALVHLTIGLSVFFTPLLRHIPMPVLYGVFLFMGVASLQGVQFVQRILLIFMPTKYQPDYLYLRHIPTRRVHIFTAIELCGLALLWVIKKIKVVSIAFPLMVLALIAVRKLILGHVFSESELSWLDDLLPTNSKKPMEFEETIHEHGDESKNPLVKGSQAMNISKQVQNTGIWIHLENKKRDQDINQDSRSHMSSQSSLGEQRAKFIV